MSRKSWQNVDFDDDMVSDGSISGGIASWLFLLCTLALLFSGLVWAQYAELEEVSRGTGRIIPSGKIQVVQSLEGGIIEEIFVRTGESITKGQLLLKIDDTNFTASLGEILAREYALKGKISRLESELAERREISFTEELKVNAPEVIASETKLFLLRRSNNYNNNAMLSARKDQREQELLEMKSNLLRIEDELSISRQELTMNENISDIVPQSEILRLRKDVGRLEGEINVLNSSILRANSAVKEARITISSGRSDFQQGAQAELTQARADLNVLAANLDAAGDRVNRSGVRSPVDGVISTMHVNTLGGVVQAGSDLVEIVPLGESLLIEARIRPQDIAFLSPNQKARIKITAYDFSIYGGLDGYVERIGADSMTDEISGETYFPIDIRADAANFKKDNEILPISPGMVASVDIITGHKSVLEYLLKPVKKAKYEGLRER